MENEELWPEGANAIFVCGGKSWLIVDDSTFEELESE
jgi:hypothetical protein